MVAGERAAGGVRAVHARREPDDDEGGVDGAERRDRTAEVAGIAAFRTSSRNECESCAAPARGIVRERGSGFWQNGGSFGGGHGTGAHPPPSMTWPAPGVDAVALPAPPPAGNRCASTPRPISRCFPPNPTSRSARACPREQTATAASRRLLFVHGGYSDAWVLGPVLPALVRRKGLRLARACHCAGTASSAGGESLFVAGLDDFAADVEHVACGTSGAAGADRPFDGCGDRRAPARHAPGSRCRADLAGAARRAPARWPRASPPGPPTIRSRFSQFDPARMSRHVLEALHPFYFSDDVAPEILAEASSHLCAGVAARVARPLDAAALAASRARRRSAFRAGRRGRQDLDARRCPRNRAAPRRRGDAGARPRAHADAGAEVGEAGEASCCAGSPRCSAGAQAIVRSGYERQPGTDEPLECPRRQRPAHPVALETVAAAGREKLELHLRPHALGDDVQAQPAREPDDRRGDRRVARIGLEVRDERDVDLQRVDREVLADASATSSRCRSRRSRR